MKIIRNKRVKKILAFYRNYFEFRTPYQVLIDGTFSLAALNFHIKLDEQVAKLFEAEVKLCTTSCIISESEALKKILPGPLQILHRCHVSKCHHKNKPVSATECLLSMVKSNNSRHYIVATQDKNLQKSLHEIPGVPVMFIDRTLCLESPSEASRRVELYGSAALQAGQPLDYEQVTLKLLKKKILGKKPKIEIKKRKRAKGPNPLSCKKKKKPEENFVPHNQDGVKKTGRKRKRMKIKQHQHDS